MLRNIWTYSQLAIFSSDGPLILETPSPTAPKVEVLEPPQSMYRAGSSRSEFADTQNTSVVGHC